MTHHARMEFLTPEDLSVVPHLQRQVSSARVKKLATKWNPQLVGVLEAAEMVGPQGEPIFHLIDGQTRMLAAAQYGEHNGVRVVLPVAIYEDMSEEQIALLFLARNQLASKVPAYDQYWVGIEAGVKQDLMLRDALASTKFDMARKATAYEISAAGAMRASTAKMMKAYGDGAEAAIASMLNMAHDAWPLEEGDRVAGDILHSLTFCLIEWASLLEDGPERARFIEQLHDTSPRQWMVDARKVETEALSSGARYKSIVKLWAEAYNKNIGNTKPKLEKLTV